MVPKIYLIPGLGADSRLFEGLRRSGLEFEVLEFIPPIPNETLRDYALRMGKRIDTTLPYIIGGQSLGGTMATEIANSMNPEKLILISSLKHSREFPFYFRLARILPIHRLLSGGFIRRNGPRARITDIPAWQGKILRDMRSDADDTFVKWAVNAILHWRSDDFPKNHLHIHGTHDRLFPVGFVRGCIRIEGGNHVMVLTHAAEIVAEIRQFLGTEK